MHTTKQGASLQPFPESLISLPATAHYYGVSLHPAPRKADEQDISPLGCIIIVTVIFLTPACAPC